MDPSRGKLHYSYRSYRTPQYNLYQENINYGFPPTNALCQKTGIQRQTLKWKKDSFYRGNHRRPAYRRNDAAAKKSNKSEDVEEEERKKKLTDTAKKLLSKIKPWSAGDNLTVNENNTVHSEENIDSEDKPKRIAHAKKVKNVKKTTRKKCKQPAKKKIVYDVNKETVKDFQSRIQHKLMGEIMQMPKENLQNVLNDPKINPIMELKMSRLVRENRLLIAHRLRAIAETKMKSDCPSNPQFLVDIDKLIDPVIESDLSVLPYELIKQMENIFQVQFDYSHNSENSVGEGDGVVDNTADEETTTSEKNIKAENNEDLSLYECSTDEDEETTARPQQETDLNMADEVLNMFETPEIPTDTADVKSIVCNENQVVNEEKSLENLIINVLENDSSMKATVSEEPTSNSSPVKQFASIYCQTECNLIESSTQTQCNLVESLYGAPLPKETVGDNVSSLLEEVSSIQNLVNKLNERRLMIFLQLAKLKPSGDFIGDNTTRKNFIETVSNGNLHLVDALNHFFTSIRPDRHKNMERQ